MKINSVSAFNNTASYPSFGRKLNNEEREACRKDIQAGLDVLGKNMAIILPTNCSPSVNSKDIGIGQPYSKSSEALLMPFLHDWGFSKWQQEPAGLRKPTDPSPYVSNSSAYNTLIIDLEPLTTADNGKILSKATYENIKKQNPNKGTERTAYLYSTKSNAEALEEAYKTFAYKKEHIDELTGKEKKGIEKLSKDFDEFKAKHGDEQEKNALYSVLSKEHNNDYWPNWGSDVDKNLFANSTPTKEAQKRITELKKNHGEEIESFLFSQMLAKKEIDKGNKEMEKNGIKPIADIPVANSDAQVWGHKHLYLPNMRMGCHDPWSDEKQQWGFWVLDPEQMFNKDNTLGPAGQFLYDKYQKLFEENPGGVRIDHIVGLMDPWVYDEKNPEHSGRLYSELYKGKNGIFCDKILKNIVIPAAKATGLDTNAIIAEDLGYMPGKTAQTLRDLNIGGTKVTQWLNMDEIWNAPKNSTAMVANHDTRSARECYPDKYERRNKFAELFATGSNNIQIFWTDLLGKKERYNEPGKSGDENWSLRMKENFDDEYHKELQKGEAVNIPEAILEANRRRNPEFSHENYELAESLDHWANVLKEKDGEQTVYL